MKHRVLMRLPRHTREEYLRALMDPGFHLEKWRRLGALRCDLLEQGLNGPAAFFRVSRRIRNTAPVPALLAKFIPDEATFQHRDEWNPVTGTGRIEVYPGVPIIKVRADTAVIAAGAGCEQAFDWDIRSTVPLVGGAVEKFVIQNLDRDSAAEAAVVEALLDQRR